MNYSTHPYSVDEVGGGTVSYLKKKCFFEKTRESTAARQMVSIVLRNQNTNQKPHESMLLEVWYACPPSPEKFKLKKLVAAG